MALQPSGALSKLWSEANNSLSGDPKIFYQITDSIVISLLIFISPKLSRPMLSVSVHAWNNLWIIMLLIKKTIEFDAKYW